MMCEWRDVPGFPLYQASDDGRVLSRRSGTALILAQFDSDGYRVVNVKRGGKAMQVPVHRLVLLAFRGEPADGQTLTRHLNGNRADNRPDNLAWGTTLDNFFDAMLHGTCRVVAPRDQHAATKFTTATVAEMRAMSERGESDKAIAARFKTNPWYVRTLMKTVGV